MREVKVSVKKPQVFVKYNSEKIICTALSKSFVTIQ